MKQHAIEGVKPTTQKKCATAQEKGRHQTALLFWQLLLETLTDWGFKLNEYDKCVTNKTIDCKQCTIIWNLDDLKISHMDCTIVEDMISKLNEKFGQESPLVTSLGKTLEYLGMCLDYTTKGKVKISMYEYINKM